MVARRAHQAVVAEDANHVRGFQSETTLRWVSSQSSRAIVHTLKELVFGSLLSRQAINVQDVIVF